MSDVAIRDRLLAYALLGYITPARARLLLDSGISHNASASFIRQGLRIDDPAREREVREPLTVERVQRGLAEYRDAALTLVDDDYPELLRHLPDPPLALFYRGNTALLKKPAVAMVGGFEKTLVIAVVLAIAVAEVWFFFFAGSSIGSG